jgi:pyruvate formate lyase activating enzyme
VLVPGLTDDYDNVEKVADICAGLRSLTRVEVLRFHQLGMEKYKKLKMPYPLETSESPTPELADRVRRQFRSRGLLVF